MGSYPFEQFTRVVIAPTVATLSAPTLAEIAAGADITCDLTKDGLALPRDTESIPRWRWHELFLGQDPGRYTLNGAVLKGKRRTPGDDEVLWDAAVFRTSAVLIVRYGILFETPWADAQPCETLRIRFGKRHTTPTAANTTAMFMVPLFVTDDEDQAVVVS